MIIVSQEKDGIINFDNILVIRLSTDFETKKKTIIYVDCVGDEHFGIGKYDTEERAKEVLQEIWKFYEIAKRYECSSNNGITIFLEPKFSYVMPEK